MILTCPACATRYLVDPAALGSDGRTVRCAKCGHQWFQTPPADRPPVADLTPPPREIRPIPPGSNLPALARGKTTSDRAARRRWGAFIAVVVVLVAGLLLGRETVVGAWPATARLYETIGLPVAPPGAGLQIQNVESRQRIEDGVPVLVVTGQIVNVSDRDRPVPPVVVVALGSDQQALERWIVPVSQDRLMPGEVAVFEWTIRERADAITEIAITFQDG